MFSCNGEGLAVSKEGKKHAANRETDFFGALQVITLMKSLAWGATQDMNTQKKLYFWELTKKTEWGILNI